MTRRRKRTSERGGALVEFAFAFPVFLLLMLSLIDFGYIYSGRIQTRNGTREAARTAAVGKVGNAEVCDINAATPLGIQNKRLICLTKERLGAPVANSRVHVILIDPTYVPTTNVWDPQNSLVVCTMSKAVSVTGIIEPFLGNAVHRNRTVIQLEKLTAYQPIATGGESPLPSQTWDWCGEDL